MSVQTPRLITAAAEEPELCAMFTMSDPKGEDIMPINLSFKVCTHACSTLRDMKTKGRFYHSSLDESKLYISNKEKT